MKPLMVDLFAGLGGWAQGGIAEGYYVVGFDIERHDYGTGGYPAQLVLQDVLTLHGSQFRDAALIVASPPCQEYSYMAMPWSRAKAIEAEYKSGVRDVKNLTALFDACFRIQREAIEAAGHFIPLVVENVRGAQKWVGRSRWNYGSYHLWGDVPALMPMTKAVRKFNPDGTDHPPGSWFAVGNSEKRGWLSQANGAPMRRDDEKVPGFRFDGSGKSFQTASVEGMKNDSGGSWFGIDSRGNPVEPNNARDKLKTVGHANIRDGHSHTRHLTNQAKSDAIECGGDWFNAEQPSISRMTSSGSKARKAASAAIARIPLPLARHIARYWR